MLGFLGELGLPTIVAATKIDKLSSGAVAKRVSEIAAQVGIDEAQIIPFSAITGEGRDELAGAIVDLIAQPSWREAEAPESDEEVGDDER